MFSGEIRMRRNYFFIIVSAILPVFLSGCSTGDKSVPSCCLITTPAVMLTGEKSSVESQIVGEYKELEKDAWVISSVKTNVQKGLSAPVAEGSDEELIEAIRIREFHENKIRGYKDEGVIGEKNDGFVQYREAHKYERDSESKKILSVVIEEENKARRTIFTRSLVKSGIEKPGEDEIAAFGRMFAEEQRAAAVKNDWIQEKSGVWVRKK
jgi:hypothetical protein